MATYSSHRLIMGKEETDNFFCLIGDIWIFFTEMFIEKSSTFHTTFVQIGEFDWLSARQKGSIFVKMFKNLLLRNHIGDEAGLAYMLRTLTSTKVVIFIPVG